MVREIRLDPRPTYYDSMVEAPASAAPVTVDAALECDEWTPRDVPAAVPNRLVFVDGVQRVDMRISAEGEGWPIPGAMVSYAAGSMVPGDPEPLTCAYVERRVILANGATPVPVCLKAHNGDFEYLPHVCHGLGWDEIAVELNSMRALLERRVVRDALHYGAGLVVCDGRLPELEQQAPVVGLIKTLAELYVTLPQHYDCLAALKTGQRSPVFLIQRERGAFYAWYVCLRTPGSGSLSLSGICRLEMAGALPPAEVFTIADLTAALLPGYASSPARDDRAPQNLLPVGQLERELRHRLGDSEYLRRLLMAAFAREVPSWTP